MIRSSAKNSAKPTLGIKRQASRTRRDTAVAEVAKRQKVADDVGDALSFAENPEHQDLRVRGKRSSAGSILKARRA
jgi:hypothetical protein